MIRVMDDERITFTELARRVGLSQQRISQLARDDPDFPPRYRAGPSWQVSWPEAERYFAERRRSEDPHSATS
jgi:transcriptional regulator with XRE-family HTH domain